MRVGLSGKLVRLLLPVVAVAVLPVSLTGCAAGQSAVPTQPATSPSVVTQDIDRFWTAYDLITAEDDPRIQTRILNEYYIDRGSPGLHAMMRARSYRTGEFIQAINEAPLFWNAVRANTMRAKALAPAIETGLGRMRSVYPASEPVPVYFVIGALRAGGTAIDGKLLIGAELAMADSSTPVAELMARFPHLASYFEGSPIDNIVALNLHEWVHTQQRSEGGVDLLSQALFEGVAEYVSTEAIGMRSRQPAIVFGEANARRVLSAFAGEIGNEDFSGWIWNDRTNDFGTRDLGYYVGYAIAESDVRNGGDPDAIGTLIELDYTDLDAVDAIVDASRLFDRPVSQYRTAYEKLRPAAD